MRILVTGVTGFLGGRIAEALHASGHAVRGLARDPERVRPPREWIETVPGDVTDAAAFEAAARGCDVVVHAAAFVKVWAKDREVFDRTNVGGARNAIAAVRAANARLVYTSSFIALGPTDGATFDEETPRVPGGAHNDYERTKWEADRLVRGEAAAGCPVVRIYPGVVYGPGALTAGNHVVGNLLQHARGKLPGMLGNGDRRMSLAYVDDVAAGFVAAVERAPAGSAYILGGDNRTLADLFAVFAAETGVPPPRLKIPYGVATAVGFLQRKRADWFGVEPELTDEVVGIYRHEWAYASARAVRELGYRVTRLEDGIARTVAWLRERGDLPSAAGAR